MEAEEDCSISLSKDCLGDKYVECKRNSRDPPPCDAHLVPFQPYSLGNEIICRHAAFDPNKNVAESNDTTSLDHEKMTFDFLVWHHQSDQKVAEEMYIRLEKEHLRGFIPERDKIVGQYKLFAMDNAIRTTKHIILLLSRDAITCKEFNQKMHQTIAVSQANIIPVRLGIDKKDIPRALRHHVDIRCDDVRFFNRLYDSITRPKLNDRDVGNDVVSQSKSKITSLDEPMSRSLQLDTKPIPLVPRVKDSTQKHHSSSQKKKSGGSGFWSLFKRGKPVEQIEADIQMKSMKGNSNKHFASS